MMTDARSAAAPVGVLLDRRHGPRDTDLAARGRLLQAGAWGLMAGLITGAVAAMKMGPIAGAVAFSIMSVGAPALAITATEGVGGIVGLLVHPRAGVRHREYSHAESLIARGRYEDAIATLQAAILEDARDPRPYAYIARTMRDQLDRPQDALRWFRRARDEADMEDGDRFILVREMLSLARSRLPDPIVVAPDLARHAHAYEGTDEERWARENLAQLKERLTMGTSELPLPPRGPGAADGSLSS